MKRTRFLIVMTLVVVILMSSLVPIAYAGGKHKTKTVYSIVIRRDTCEIYVFAKKVPGGAWKLLGKDICSVGNPFWPTPAGTFVVWKKSKNYKLDGEKFSYATYFGCHRMVICAAPKFKKNDFCSLGAPCTMGQVWLRSSKAKWIYKHIPNGTKVYIF